MKLVLALFATAFSLNALASEPSPPATENPIVPKIATLQTDAKEDLKLAAESGLTTRYNSETGAATLLSLTVLSDFDKPFQYGLRGFVPLDSAELHEIYGGELLGRWYFLEGTDVFLEATFGQLYTQKSDDEWNIFTTVGTVVGFLHKISDDFSFGVSAGADFSTIQDASPRVAFVFRYDF